MSEVLSVPVLNLYWSTVLLNKAARAFKKLFLGNSSDIWQQFLREETLKQHCQNTIKKLPIENVFFIDLFTWDEIMQILKNNRSIQLVDILKYVKSEDSVIKTKKEWFSMHLSVYDFDTFNLNYLTSSLEIIKDFNTKS